MTAFDFLSLGCATGCGLMAGLFFAFSNSVMKALGKVPVPCGIAGMQSINVVIVNPLFLGIFLGTAIACAVAAVLCVLHPQTPGAAYAIAAALLYLAGSLAVTMLFNVPRNNALDRLNPAAPESAAAWQRYLAEWTAWNHVRTAASLAASVLFVLRAYMK